MFATLALVLVLPAQAPPPAPAPKPAPIPAAAVTPLPVNSVVDLAPPGLAAVDLATLHELIDLARRADLSAERKRAGYEAIKRAGRVVEFAEGTRMVLRDVTPDAAYRDERTGRPTLVYSGMILDGPLARRDIFVLGDQIAEPARPDEMRMPTAEELAAQHALDRANRERVDRVYRAAKSSRAAAKGKAGAADLSVRKAILARETTAWRRRLMKEHKLSEGELDAIIASGEEEDGTADRRAAKHLEGKAEAQARNDEQLMAIGAMIDRAGAAVLAAQPVGPSLGRTPDPFRLPLMGGVVVRGNPWSTWAPTFHTRTTAR